MPTTTTMPPTTTTTNQTNRQLAREIRTHRGVLYGDLHGVDDSLRVPLVKSALIEVLMEEPDESAMFELSTDTGGCRFLLAAYHG